MVVAATGLGPGLDTAIAEGDGPPDPAHALDVTTTLLAAHGAPLWLDLVAGAHPELERAALDRGMRPAVRRPLMVAAVEPSERGEEVAFERDTGVGVARPEDLGRLRALYVECFGMPRAYAERLMTPAALAHPGSVRLVWRDPGDGVVAMAAAHIVGPARGTVAGDVDIDVAVFGVATRSRDRGRGIAGALVAAAVAAGAERGARLAWLMAEPDAVGVYRRVGFEVVGTQVAWAG
jgi:ribosomal protein S18 acetylase RimI-like enzyme